MEKELESDELDKTRPLTSGKKAKVCN